MKGLLRVVVIGGVLMAAPPLAVLQPLNAALATVAAGAILAAVLSGSPSPLALGLGAAGALVHTALAPVSVALAGGALFAIAMGARAVRARSIVARVAILAIAFTGGGAGVWIGWAYVDATAAVQAASVAVAALLASSALVVAVDDPVAYRLRELAARANAPLRTRLLRGVAIRRRYLDAQGALSRHARRRLERAWRSFVRTAAVRVDGGAAARSALDVRLGAYVHGLRRVTRTAVEARALERGVDDAAFAELFVEGDDVAARAEALAEAEAVVTRSV